MAHLITGYAGTEHIQSADDGAFNASFFGEGQFVMEQGNQFEASIINNNTIRVLDGNGLMYGRHFRINPDTHEDLTIETGTAGKNRIDLIVMTYAKDSREGTESAYLQVIKGTESSGTPSVPSYTNGNILEGATFNQMPLYKVKIEGVVLSDIEPLFVTQPTYKALAEQYASQFQNACETYLGALNILDTREAIEANTQANQLAGALGVKEISTDLRQLNSNLTDKVDAISGTTSEEITYEKVNGIGYDSENNKLMIKVGASTEPIPFSSGDKYALVFSGNQTLSAKYGCMTSFIAIDDEYVSFDSTTKKFTVQKAGMYHFNGHDYGSWAQIVVYKGGTAYSGSYGPFLNYSIQLEPGDTIHIWNSNSSYNDSTSVACWYTEE